ncbi:GntR family transcriptional regulator [Salipiger mucosus]|uniref:Transcriptional regulator, GntR family n=1 Tax=Salipiger mucosus DSM 16094 TaxID=1123237 RepID=S9QQE0_9RHOB|nr:GntR family transcriptional regulator [Salipiger mucosus]EPX81872.1 Transcriptional regulator, GntR family [Salipiger mucosus DSM 16094]
MDAATRNAPDTGAKKQKKPSLTETVYAQLRREILTCELKPGADLSEADLAARFEVSKTPVREALAALRLDGLIRTFPRRGYQVAAITFGDMNELFDVRTILESGAAELATSRITEAELADLAELAEGTYDASAQTALAEFVGKNRSFHLAIARASRNERLYTMLERQIDELERFFYLGATLRDVNSETNEEHKEIVEVLASRDPARAREIMIRHNDATRQGLMTTLANSPNFGSVSL